MGHGRAGISKERDAEALGRSRVAVHLVSRKLRRHAGFSQFVNRRRADYAWVALVEQSAGDTDLADLGEVK